MIENHCQTGQAERILPGGECIVRSEKDTYLIANAVPGDELAFQPLKKRRGALRARLEHVIVASTKRMHAACDKASTCGGCVLQYVSLSEQLIIKSDWVRQAFAACVNDATLWHPLEAFGSGQRRRLRWYVGQDDEGAFLGFHARSSHDVIRADDCMVITPELNTLRQHIQATLQDHDCADMTAMQVIHLHDGIHVIIESKQAIHRYPFAMVEDINTLPIQWWQRQDGVTRPLIKPVQSFHDRMVCHDQIIHIKVGADDFIQGQQQGNQIMVEQVLDWCQGARFIVDLFSGIGNLSLPVAVLTKARVAGAELSQSSVRAANNNAKRLQVDAEYQQINLFDKADLQAFSGADVLILDPPRKGAKRICQQMGALLPKKIIMIHCDVASGGRDGSILKGLGYKLRQLKAVDLFPYAGHVEAMSLWSR